MDDPGNAGYFIDVIAKNYNIIKNNFKKGLKTHGYGFDEDIFSETIIKCSEKLSNKLMPEKEIIKYFWVAYLNTLKNYNIKNQKVTYIEETSDIKVRCTKYQIEIDILYNFIIKSIENKFGKKIATAWKLYSLDGKTYKDLQTMNCIDSNFHYILKKIKKYIKYELMSTNPKMKEILNNL